MARVVSVHAGSLANLVCEGSRVYKANESKLLFRETSAYMYIFFFILFFFTDERGTRTRMPAHRQTLQLPYSASATSFYSGIMRYLFFLSFFPCVTCLIRSHPGRASGCDRLQSCAESRIACRANTKIAPEFAGGIHNTYTRARGER